VTWTKGVTRCHRVVAMAPRAYWKGYLKLSLVSFPIKLFPATADREKVRFHQINRESGNRIKYIKVDAGTGEPVDDEDIVRGYEVGRGRYLEITNDELEAIAAQGTHTIEIDQFVPKDEIDEIYWAIPYYIAPDGDLGRQAFSVIREAIRKEHMVALGRVVFTTREHVVAIQPRGKGTMGLTLRYPYEIRDEELYFSDITDEKVPKDMLDLAVAIVRSKARHFQPDKFEDHYESALRELIGKKQRREKIEPVRKRPQAQVVNLMDALRRSAEADHRATRARTQVQRATPRGQRTPRGRPSAQTRMTG
jgi:DNA end-binding protein Ku